MLLTGNSFSSLQSVPRSEPIVSDLQDGLSLYDSDMEPGVNQKTYTVLEPSKTWSSKIVTARGNCVDLRSWTMTHPEQWKNREVLDWIFTVVQLIEDFKIENFAGEKFNKLNGEDLCKMQLEDFKVIDPVYGEHLYKVLQDMLKKASFKEPGSLHDFQPPADHFYIKEENIELPSTVADAISGSMNIFGPEQPMDQSNGCYNIDGYMYDYTLSDSPPLPTRSQDEDPGYSSSSESPINPAYGECISPDHIFTASTDFYGPCPSMDALNVPSPVHLPQVHKQSQNSQVSSNTCNHTIRRGPGRPRRRQPSSPTSDFYSDEERPRSRPGTHKGNHLWEFIRDLLKMEHNNNQLIRWENREDGVFKIVNSEQVAKMWGAKKNNHTMTYEKFSRAMRFCRSAGYFSDVPKTGNYPKKLCFKFGPKSFGWQE